MMQGKQQQRAIPIRHAKTTQNMAKITSKAKNTTANLQYLQNQISIEPFLGNKQVQCNERSYVQAEQFFKLVTTKSDCGTAKRISICLTNEILTWVCRVLLHNMNQVTNSKL